MQQPSQTPLLDQVRPRVLEALRVRGWRVQPTQVDGTFVVRARRAYLGREYAARVEFREAADAVHYQESGDGAAIIARDLREEGAIQ